MIVKVCVIGMLTCIIFSFNLQKIVGITRETHVSAQKDLFDSDKVFTITIKGNTRELLNDRSDNPQSHSLELSYKNEDSSEITMPVEIQTRGHFRKLRENCTYPPLMIHFSHGDAHNSSVFKEQSKLKLVMPCAGEDYLIREWLVYKIYNLISPFSFRARLVKIKLEDPKSKKTATPFYGILLEEEKQMATRNKALPADLKLRPQQAQPDAFLTMAVFEYLIGNTDWSVEYLQNIKLVKTDPAALPITVPYDFDHAGIVNAQYAHPAEELLMSSIRERRYRGYCVTDLKAFEGVITLFNRLKTDIYKLYSGCALLDTKYINATIRYLDDFYTTISIPKAWQRDFAYPCDRNGTGNVVIKGLKED